MNSATEIVRCRQIFKSELLGDLLREGQTVHFHATGASMLPFLRSGAIVTVVPRTAKSPVAGDIVLYEVQGTRRAVLHRVIGKTGHDGLLIRADGWNQATETVWPEQVLGTAVRYAWKGKSRNLRSLRSRLAGMLWQKTQPVGWIVLRLMQSVRRKLRVLRSSIKAQSEG